MSCTVMMLSNVHLEHARQQSTKVYLPLFGLSATCACKRMWVNADTINYRVENDATNQNRNNRNKIETQPTFAQGSWPHLPHWYFKECGDYMITLFKSTISSVTCACKCTWVNLDNISHHAEKDAGDHDVDKPQILQQNQNTTTTIAQGHQPRLPHWHFQECGH